MKTFNFSCLILVCSITLGSCGSDKNQEGVSKEPIEKDGATKESIAESKAEEKPDVKFLFKSTSDDEMSPAYDVSISINGKTTFLANIVGNVEEIEDIGGKNSIASCGAFWAGAGDYFYAAPSEKGITVYKGWMDEGQETPGYHWEVFKELSK